MNLRQKQGISWTQISDLSKIPLPNTHTLEGFESLQRYARASGYKLKEPCSHLLSIFFNYLPEPPHHRRFWGAVLEEIYIYEKNWPRKLTHKTYYTEIHTSWFYEGQFTWTAKYEEEFHYDVRYDSSEYKQNSM